MEELIELGNPGDENGKTLSYYMAELGYEFIPDELRALGNPADKSWRTVAEIKSMNDYGFTRQEKEEFGLLL